MLTPLSLYLICSTHRHHPSHHRHHPSRHRRSTEMGTWNRWLLPSAPPQNHYRHRYHDRNCCSG
ncbi:hypothetical protein M8C21_008698 [Ambrosia artemisiifolia]|uniref:Uncharacterized protein n=1 Tax=Ambrosia artemisiifolia TaxID=4212 RepID=A0AAD5GGQ4_AMBAR|nr:hypothetical protein M8C21_008698 [Ambrosia artemisiifolia]